MTFSSWFYFRFFLFIFNISVYLRNFGPGFIGVIVVLSFTLVFFTILRPFSSVTDVGREFGSTIYNKKKVVVGSLVFRHCLFRSLGDVWIVSGIAEHIGFQVGICDDVPVIDLYAHQSVEAVQIQHLII